MLIHLAKFALVCGVILFVAWMAGTGRVAPQDRSGALRAPA